MIKDIQLCGLGNGLVDVQFEVGFDVTKELEVTLGQMLLVEKEWQKKLQNKLSDFPRHTSSGGSAANSIIAFSELGGKAGYQTSLGNDEYGHFYADEFNKLGIQLSTPMLDTEPSGTCFVLITPDSERTMLTHLGASAIFNVKNIDEDQIKRSNWMYIEGYLFTQQETFEAVEKAVEIAKKSNTRIAVTFSDFFITEHFNEKLRKITSQSDLVFCNESEAQSFTKTTNSELAFTKLTEIVPNVAITFGKRGSKIKWYDETVTIPAYRTDLKDTTGAGDMFAGCFLYGILNGESVFRSGHLASLASSKIVAQYGARYNGNLNDLKDRIYNDFY